jgi:transcriptional regulator with XRE-family HTH domain
MAKRSSTHTPPDDNFENVVHLSPRHLTKQEFGKRLYALMTKKTWTQSELGRAAGLGRDSISTYIRGRSMPSPKGLKKLAVALGVEVEELLPNSFEAALDNEIPAIELKMSQSDPETAWLRVNRAVSMETALQVLELIKRDEKS